jgi:hypothetical protein
MIRSYELKLLRAEHHIMECERLVFAWIADEGYRVIQKTNSKGRSELLAEMLKEIPWEIPLSIGDAIHCLRDSLDHLAFDLAVSGSPTLTEKQERMIQFPIRKTIVEVGDRRIAPMSIDAQKAVIGLLPDPTGNQFRHHPLWLLNEMNNCDKHRRISIVVASSYVGSLSISASNGSDYFHIIDPARPVIGGGPIVFLEFSRSPHVKADIAFTTQIEFDKETDVSGKPVFLWLRSVEKHIRDVVVPALKPFL